MKGEQQVLRDIPKPLAGEYPAYARMYIDLVPGDGRVLDHLRERADATAALMRGLSDESLLSRYAPEKWTVKEVLVHIIDDERIYAYRALRFARNDETPLPGFDQDAFASCSAANARSLDSILAEYVAVRHATIALFNGMDDVALTRSGTADGRHATVRALAYHIAGHELHHLELLRTRYHLPMTGGRVPGITPP